ncbi:MAG: hypothetical protein WC872_02560, partial [Candidatus Absconditabacterales bacterium]
FALGDIIPLKSKLDRKIQEELNQSELYKILQLAFSDSEFYFQVNPKNFIKNDNFHNKQVYNKMIDYAVLYTDKLPDGFFKKFNIPRSNLTEQETQNIKNIFKQAKPLKYVKDKQKTTYRVLFVDGKLIIFRTEKKLLLSDIFQEGGKQYETNKYMNTYSDIYSAIRSQNYAIETSEDSSDFYKQIQKDFVKMINDIKINTKHLDTKRKLDEIIQDIDNARSFKIMASKLQNLEKISFSHSERDKNLLIGAKNKFSNKLYELNCIIKEIDLQLNEMENILIGQESDFQNLLDNIHKLFYSRNIYSESLYKHDIFNYFNSYQKNQQKSEYKIHPFLGFQEQMKNILPSNLQDALDNKKLKNKILLKIEMLYNIQDLIFKSYKIEHQIKLGKEILKDPFELRHLETLKKKYPEVYPILFQDFEDKIKYFNEKQKSESFSKVELNNFFKDFRDQYSLYEKIDLLKKL